MIKSMTAFARAEAGDALRSVVAEIRSYNSRHLDLALRLPSAYAGLEDKVKGLVAAAVTRGRVEVRLQIEAKTEEAVVFAVNAPRAVAYHRALTELKKLVNIDAPVTLEQLVGIGDMIKPAEGENDVSSFWPLIEESLGRALSDLDTMRRREGEFIAADIGQRIDGIAYILEQIETAASGLLEKYRDRLQERITTLTDGIIAIDGDRIIQEAAISGHSVINRQFSRNSGNDTAILPAVIAIGWKSGFCCLINTAPSDCDAALITVPVTPRMVAVEIEMPSMKTTLSPIKPMAIPVSLIPDKDESFSIRLAITLVMIGDRPKTRDIQPLGICCALQ